MLGIEAGPTADEITQEVYNIHNHPHELEYRKSKMQQIFEDDETPKVGTWAGSILNHESF